jgi:hypothetical protein
MSHQLPWLLAAYNSYKEKIECHEPNATEMRTRNKLNELLPKQLGPLSQPLAMWHMWPCMLLSRCAMLEYLSESLSICPAGVGRLLKRLLASASARARTKQGHFED